MTYVAIDCSGNVMYIETEAGISDTFLKDQISACGVEVQSCEKLGAS